MKNLYTEKLVSLLFFSLVLFTTSLQAKDYYVSATGNDANDGLTPTTAWKSISKVNSMFSKFVAGDKILFQSGHTFYGTIIVNKSGVSGNPITIGAFGTGARPVITGFTAVSGWVSTGTNIWQSAAITGKNNTISMVTVGNIPTGMGRWPNANAANGGYMNFETHNSNISITDNELTSSPNWTGATVNRRVLHDILSRDPITNHTGKTITYTNMTGGYIPKDGYGYFIENSLSTLDVQNEWYFNESTRKLSMYSASAPANVKLATLDTLLFIGQSDYITVDGLAFEGSNIATISLGGPTLGQAVATTIKNCTISFSGRDAIYATYNNGLIVTNNIINHSLNNAILLESEGGNSLNSTITYNTIKNTGAIAGMGYFNFPRYASSLEAISAVSNPSAAGVEKLTVKFNHIDTVGHVGIRFYTNDARIDSNFINYHNFITDDGGAINTFDNTSVGSNAPSGITEVNRTIVGNIITNGIGAGYGSPAGYPLGNVVNGIYVDDKADGVLIKGNSVANTATGEYDGAAIYIHNGTNMNIRENTSYNSGYAGTVFSEDDHAIGMPIRGIQYKKNLVFQTKGTQKYEEIRTYTSDIAQMFTARDSNRYARPVSITGNTIKTIQNYQTSYTPTNSYTFAGWKADYPAYGKNSTEMGANSGASIFIYNASSKDTTFSFPGLSYTDPYGAVVNNSVTLAPWSSRILIANGSAAPLNQPPVANAGTDKVITLPANSTTLTGSGTDVTGTISSYAWSKISGPATGTIATANTAATTVNSLVQGVYQYELTVTDNEGAKGKDTVKVTVNAALNQPPVANAGTDKVITLPANSTTLTGSGTDVTGTISSYAWLKISGPAAGTIATANTAATTVNSLVQGVYQYELTVTDNEGAKGKDTVQVTVKATPNQSPVADAGSDKAITLPTNTATLTGKGTDADGTVSSYAWVKISGPSAGTITTPNAATTTVSNLVQGNYQYELTITDNNGAIEKDTLQVTVNAANKLPVADAGIAIVILLPGNSTTLKGIGTDEDGTISKYDWVKISGPASGTIANANAATTALNNLERGIYKYELTVTDNNGAQGKDTVQVRINTLPTANAGADITITLPTNTAGLNGSGKDVDGTISSYNWVKISGPSAGTITTPTTAGTTVNNLVQGVYEYELTVKDNNATEGKDTVQVTVNAAPNKAPVANAGSDKTITLPTNTTTLTGSGTDEDGTVASYAWVKISGPSAGTITTPTAASTTVNNLVQGVYQYELTITDNNGAKAKDIVQVTVNAATTPALVANAGTDTTIKSPSNSTILSGSGKSTEGAITSYKWVKVSGPFSGKIALSDSATTLVKKLVVGIYKFELTVTNNNGKKAKDTVQVTVGKAAKQPPLARAGSNSTITLPINTTTLSGNNSVAEDTIRSTKWVKISGPSSGTITTANNLTTQVNNLAQGIYKFELTVTDNEGSFGKDTVEVTVNAAVTHNILPVTNAGTAINNGFKVYPNPVRDIANLNFTTKGNSKLSISVTDMSGRVVKYNELSNLDQSKTFKLDMSDLIDGYYVITVRFEDGQRISEKVIKNGNR